MITASFKEMQNLKERGAPMLKLKIILRILLKRTEWHILKIIAELLK